MDLFFFGSLMDGDVAAIVLNRPLAPTDRQPAVAYGFRRAILAGESYPVMVPRAGGSVLGILVGGITPAERERIAWFEDGEYDLETIVVTLDSGERREAQACLRRRDVAIEERDWSFARWQREDKPLFLDLARGWMALHGRATVAEAEAIWQATKRRVAESTRRSQS